MDGWSEEGEVRRAFTQDRNKASQNEEALMLSYVQDQVQFVLVVVKYGYMNIQYYTEADREGDGDEGNEAENEDTHTDEKPVRES
jgi:hypothetical protein